MSIQIPAPAGTGRRRAVLAAAFIAALVAPLAVAPPAFAAKTAASCTVTALKPKYYNMDSSGRKVYDYPVHVKCTRGDRTVYVQQQYWEDDGDHWYDRNDYQGKYNHAGWYFKNAGERTFHSYKGLSNTEEGNEEIYQKARIGVYVSDVDKWSKWDVGRNTNAP